MEAKLLAAIDWGTVEATTALQDALDFLKVPSSISGHNVELPSLLSPEDKHTERGLRESSPSSRVGWRRPEVVAGGIGPSGVVLGGAGTQAAAMPPKEAFLEYGRGRLRERSVNPKHHAAGGSVRNSHRGREFLGLRVLKDAVQGDGPSERESDPEGGKTDEEKQMEGGVGGDIEKEDSTKNPPASTLPNTTTKYKPHPREGLLEKRVQLLTHAPKSAIFIEADLESMPPLTQLVNEQLYIRAVRDLVEKEAAINRAKAAEEQAALRDCPFTPTIGDFAKGVRGSQKVEEFYAKGREWKEKVAKKLAKKREKEGMDKADDDKIVFTPWRMDSHSVEILEGAKNALLLAESDGRLEQGTVRNLEISRKSKPSSSNAYCPADLMRRARGSSGGNSGKSSPHSRCVSTPKAPPFKAIPTSNKYFLERTGGVHTPFLVRMEEDVEEREEHRQERELEKIERELGELDTGKDPVVLSPEEINESVKELHTGRCTDSDTFQRRRREALKLIRKQEQERAARDAQRAEEAAASNAVLDKLIEQDPKKYRHLASTLRGPTTVVPTIGSPAPREKLPHNKRHLYDSPAYIHAVADADRELTFTPQTGHAYYAGSEMELYNKRLAYERALQARRRKKKEEKMMALGYVRINGGDEWIPPTRALSPEEQSLGADRLQLSARRLQTPNKRLPQGEQSNPQKGLEDADDAVHVRKLKKWESVCKERNDRELHECTFSPRISDTSRKLVEGRFGDDSKEVVQTEYERLRKDQRKVLKATAAMEAAATPVRRIPSSNTVRSHTPTGSLARPRVSTPQQQRQHRTSTPDCSRRWLSPATTAHHNKQIAIQQQAQAVAEEALHNHARRDLMQRRLQSEGGIPITPTDRLRYQREAHMAIAGSPPRIKPHTGEHGYPLLDNDWMLTGGPLVKRINNANYTTADSTSLALYRSAAFGEPLSPEAFGRDSAISPIRKNNLSSSSSANFFTPSNATAKTSYTETPTSHQNTHVSNSSYHLEMRVRGAKEALAVLKAELSGAHTQQQPDGAASIAASSIIRVPSAASSTQRTASRNLTSAEYDAMSVDEFLVTILSDEGENPLSSGRSVAVKAATRPSVSTLLSTSGGGTPFRATRNNSESTLLPANSANAVANSVDELVKDLSEWFEHLCRLQERHFGSSPPNPLNVDLGASRYLEGLLPSSLVNEMLNVGSHHPTTSDAADLLFGFDEDFHMSDDNGGTGLLLQFAYIALYQAMLANEFSQTAAASTSARPDSRGISPLIWKRSPSIATTLPGVQQDEDRLTVANRTVSRFSSLMGAPRGREQAVSAVNNRIPQYPSVAERFPTRLTLPLFIALYQHLFDVEL